MKNKKYETLSTKYTRHFDKTKPLMDYPRPQLIRNSYLSLNGIWDFCEADELTDYNEKITVPYPMESLLSGIERQHNFTKNLYYRRTFTLPEGFIKSRVILHFGAVDQVCRVKLNDKDLGEHEGGYHPFSFDITDAIVDGENELSLVVRDELDIKYPYGKQTKKRGGMWYTPVSGIWQSVWIESLPENAIESLKITTDAKHAKIEVKTKASVLKLTFKESGKVFESENGIFEISPESAKLWSPESPYLYYFTLESDTDRVDSYFALREITVGEFNGAKRLLLNGKPYLFTGLLDQGYFPDGIFTPASYMAYEDDILIAKAHGFNMLRKHIKIEPLIFYHLCDKLGIVVFQDMVNNSDYSFMRDTVLPTAGIRKLPDNYLHHDQSTRNNFISGMIETTELLYNTPSVLYYTIFNEGWGQFSADENYRVAKTLDETRIIDATSGWFFGKESDVESHHIYFRKPKIKKFTKRPVVLSEFGGNSYRAEGHLFGSANYGYSHKQTREAFDAAFEKLYRDDVLPLVRSGISALVYTQLSDVEDETNGIVTYDRKYYKLDGEKTAALMRELCRISATDTSVP